MMASKKMLLGEKSVRQLLQETLHANLEKIIFNLQEFTVTQKVESLHQYRVAIRMTRCVCREFREFMEEKRQTLLEKKLKVLQKETNAMRDIDVFLEALAGYEKEVSPESQRAFETLKKKLCDEKEVLWKAFEAKYSQSEQEKVLMWFSQLKNDEKLCVAKSNEKLFNYSLQILQKRLKKIAKISQKLTLETPNDVFHALRLHYKKMRYTSDALGLATFSKSFKPIQTAFGAVQDKNTQIAHLKAYQSSLGICLEEMIALLEEQVKADKQACIEKSTAEKIETLQRKIEKIFTCKAS
jgi:CHAD domain-containing protein